MKTRASVAEPQPQVNLNSPKVNAASMLVAEHVFDRRLSLRDATATLADLDFGAVAAYLAVLNRFTEVAFESSPLRDRTQVRYLGELIGFMFHEPARGRAILQSAAEKHSFTPLSIQALLATLELAGRVCLRTGRTTELAPAERQRVSHVLLSFQSEAFSTKRLRQFSRTVHTWDQISEADCNILVQNRIAHNPNRAYVYALARIFAYANKPEISQYFQVRRKIPMDDWFMTNLGMSSQQYLLAGYMAVAPAMRFNANHPSAVDLIFEPDLFFSVVPPVDRDNARALLEVATIDGENKWAISRSAGHLTALLYESNQLHATPVISFGQRRLVVSATLLLNQFVEGLPHVSLNAVRYRQKAPLEKVQVQTIRAEFGTLFEGYVQWLFASWFTCKSVVLLQSYEAKVNGRWRERDIAVIQGDCAYVVETKVNTVDMALRSTGSFASLNRLLGEVVEQAYTSAVAFLAGDVRDKNGAPIPRVKRVVPVALIYDPIPLILPVGRKFEPWLENERKVPAFTPTPDRAAVQLLAIEDLEACEETLGAGARPEAILEALCYRADHPEHRYEQLRWTFDGTPPAGIGPVQRLIEETKDFIRQAKERLFPGNQVERDIGDPVRK